MEKIEDYFLLGSLHTAALVSKKGSIDWLCFPHFDSPSLFAKILDKNAGCFRIVKRRGYEISSKYLSRTAIVETTFQKKSSKFTLKDFMLPQELEECNNHFLIRKVKSISGEHKIKFIFNPKPGYAKEKIKPEIENSKVLFKIKDDSVILHLPKETKVHKKDNVYEISFLIKKDEEKILVFEYIVGNNKSAFDKHNFEKETKEFWKNWLKEGKYFNFYEEELYRSMITLKMMQFYPTGAMVAAPTTSLPDDIGGVRNWDYRYTWIRDATFILYAFHILECYDEGDRFFKFIKKITDEDNGDDFKINTLYTIHGKKAPEEKYLDYFFGYKNSKPVRIGNNATGQRQIDVYGALIDSHYFMSENRNVKNIEDRKRILKLAGKIEKLWKKKDGGIWEMRGDLYNYTYSKVMAWVGIDRTLRMADDINLSDSEKKKFKKLRDEIKDWIWKNCYDSKKQIFVLYPDTDRIDASNFLFVLLQFLDKHDPLTKTILKNTCKELCKKDVFVYRYIFDDGLEGKDQAFVICSYWLISALAILEDTGEALKLFKKINNYMNKSGLLSEEINPNNKEYRGNFPQAYSHLGFVMSAYYLNKYIKRKEDSKKNKSK